MKQIHFISFILGPGRALETLQFEYKNLVKIASVHYSVKSKAKIKGENWK